MGSLGRRPDPEYGDREVGQKHPEEAAGRGCSPVSASLELCQAL